MRIAHVVDSMEVGGAEILVSQMCRLQREQGHDPCVYAVATLGPLGEQLRNEGFTVQPHMGRHLSERRGTSSRYSNSRSLTLSIFTTQPRRSMRP